MDVELAKRIRGGGSVPADVLPLRCETTSTALSHLGPDPSCAIQCTTLIALVGELLVCAELRGILREDAVDRFGGSDEDRRNHAEVLRLLRNAACHPAAPVDDLAAYVESSFREETWASQLTKKPARLAARDVTLFALRVVTSIGDWQAQRWGIKKWSRRGRS